MLTKLCIDDSVATLRRRFPGALICIGCARLIASTPAAYTKSHLAPGQVDSYVCANCRSEVQVAAETSARFRTLAPRVLLKAPLRIVAAAGEPEQRRDEHDAAYRERIEKWRQHRTASHTLVGVVMAPSLYGACLVDGQHAEGSEHVLECPRRNRSKALNTVRRALLPVAHGKSRAGSLHQYRPESDTVSRLAGRRLTVRRQRTSSAQLAALARINSARRTDRGEVA